MHLALTGPDQLRQRVAWALHKIWVVSAVDIDNAGAIVTYHRVLMNGAFGNYRDLMRDVTLNPAMGRYLNMLNNRSQAVTGVPPNENYARELMQLFTRRHSAAESGRIDHPQRGRPDDPVYSESRRQGARPHLHRLDVRRRQSGDRFRRDRAARTTACRWRPSARYHDVGGEDVPRASLRRRARRRSRISIRRSTCSSTTRTSAPFISRQLIQQLVTSNPSPPTSPTSRRCSTTTAPACAATWRRWFARS